MLTEEQIKRLRGRKPCDCECHEHGKEIMHFMSCCSFTYQKYVKDGQVDMAEYNKLLEAAIKQESKK